MATTITTPDPTIDHETRLVRTPERPLLRTLAGVAVGVALGWYAGAAAADPSAPIEAPPTVVAVEEPVAERDGHPMTPDAAERWAEVERLERLELCSSSPVSADALERCMGGA